MSAAVIFFIASNPVAAGVICAALVGAIGFLAFSFAWAAKPTIFHPSDFGEEGEQ